MDMAKSLTQVVALSRFRRKATMCGLVEAPGALHVECVPHDSALNAVWTAKGRVEFESILIQLNQLNAWTTNIPAHRTHLAQAKIKKLRRDKVLPYVEYGQ